MIYNYSKLTEEEIFHDLNHLNDLVILVNKRGKIFSEVNDLRNRINSYLERIEKVNNLNKFTKIQYLIEKLRKF